MIRLIHHEASFSVGIKTKKKLRTIQALKFCCELFNYVGDCPISLISIKDLIESQRVHIFFYLFWFLPKPVKINIILLLYHAENI